MKKKFVLAIIPARKGSKGLKNKNMYPLKGKPLLYYTFDAASKSKYISSTILSSDSDKIIKYSKKFRKIECYFKRPKKLSGDRVLTYPVIVHAVKEFEKKNKLKIDYFLLLQPTSPLRSAKDIDLAISKLLNNKKGAKSIVSVTQVKASHPLRMKKINKKNLLENYVKQRNYENMKPRQILPKVFIRNGAIYLAHRSVLFKNKQLTHKICLPYLMPEERSLNIDSYADILLLSNILK
ncbi:acylneuraminate cytidylyltransferase family protein [Candidatus Pelagibacter sp. HIMB1611]|uniref:acylneuraminate cytidylyltransferase family protein n=1 Tax=unclassified Candidatus Pelagibacter TaxID=2647897 RepID=UPI003F835DC2